MFGVYKCHGSFFYFAMSSKVIEMRVRFQSQGKYQVVTEEHNRLMLAPIISQEKAPLHIGYDVACYKKCGAVLKVNKLFKRLTVTVDAKNCLLSALKQ
jgi:hypothetical protein